MTTTSSLRHTPLRRSLWRPLLRQAWVVALAAAIGLAAAFAANSAATPLYSAQASLQLSIGYSVSASDVNQGAQYTRSEILSYAEVATSESILAPVIDTLGLDIGPGALARQVAVTTPGGTSLLHVTATSPVAGETARIANAVAAELSRYIVAHSPVDKELGPLLDVTTYSTAHTPTAPVSPRKNITLAAGLLLGLFVGVVVAVLRERADGRLRTLEDVAAVTDVPVLATLRHEPRRGAGEGIRRLAATLRHSLAGLDSPAIAVVPARPHGTTQAFTHSLARALQTAGVTSSVVTSGDSSTADSGGTSAPAPAPALSAPLSARAAADHSTRLGRVREELADARRHGGVTLLATPSLAASADAALLADATGYLLLLVESGGVQGCDLEDALHGLESAGLAPLGIVLTSRHRGGRLAGLRAWLASRLGRTERPAPAPASMPAVRGRLSAGRSPSESLQRS